MSDEWIPVTTSRPEPRVVVMTKIDDSRGVRNVTPLRWLTTDRGGLWFLPDTSMYVYYNPTHWRPMTKEEGGAQ